MSCEPSAPVLSVVPPPAWRCPFDRPLAGALVALMAGMALVGQVTAWLGELSAWQTLALSLLPMQVFAVVTFMWMLQRERHGQPWGTLLGWRPAAGLTSRQCLRRLGLEWLTLLTVTLLVSQAVLWGARALGVELEAQHVVRLLVASRSPALAVLVVLSATVLAPVSEELLFRRGLHGVLACRLPRLATPLTALCFALLHGQLHTVPTLVAVGLALQWACRREGLRQAILLHAAYNASQLLLLALSLLAEP
ncbi:MAG: lysostaphin resistance A-like protein [Oligosphaeraceae bacterium]